MHFAKWFFQLIWLLYLFCMYYNFCSQSQTNYFILKRLIRFSHLSPLKKNFKIFFTTMDKLVQDKTILFVIFRFNCHNSGVPVANIQNCNFIIVIITVSNWYASMPLVTLAKSWKQSQLPLHQVFPGILERFMFQKEPWN